MYLGTEFHRYWARCNGSTHPDDDIYLKETPFSKVHLPCPFDGPLEKARVVICLANPNYPDEIGQADDYNLVIREQRSGEEDLPQAWDYYYESRIAKPIKAEMQQLRSIVSVFNVCPYLPPATTDFTAGAQRMIDKLKGQPGRKIIFIIWAGGNPFKIADMDLKRYGIEIATGGNILPAMVSYKQFPGMEGAAYYYFGMPKNPVNDAMVASHYQQFKSPPDFFTAGGFSSAMALVTALKKTNGDTSANKLINTMEGMSFDTPKGKMTFRKEDHQAMQSMYHFKIKIDPAFAWGVPELIREIKPEEMNVPIRNKR